MKGQQLLSINLSRVRDVFLQVWKHPCCRTMELSQRWQWEWMEHPLGQALQPLQLKGSAGLAGRRCSPVGHLLQGGSAELDGDVLELPVPLRAEIADHVRVLVGLAQQLHLPVCKAEALGENPLHCHITVIKGAPAASEGRHKDPSHSGARACTENVTTEVTVGANESTSRAGNRKIWPVNTS